MKQGTVVEWAPPPDEVIARSTPPGWVDDQPPAPPGACFDLAARTWSSPALHEVPLGTPAGDLIDRVMVGARVIAAVQANQVLAVATLLDQRENQWLAAVADAADRVEAAAEPETSGAQDRYEALLACPWDGSEEIAAALGLTPGTASRLVHDAAVLRTWLRVTLALLAEARIDYPTARAMVQGIRPLLEHGAPPASTSPP